jgi:hypothetical protein
MTTSTQVRIAYDRVGDGGPALLMLPGWCADRDQAISSCIERDNRFHRADSCAAFAIAAAAGTELDRALAALDDGERMVAETGRAASSPNCSTRAPASTPRSATAPRNVLPSGAA